MNLNKRFAIYLATLIICCFAALVAGGVSLSEGVLFLALASCCGFLVYRFVQKCMLQHITSIKHQLSDTHNFKKIKLEDKAAPELQELVAALDKIIEKQKADAELIRKQESDLYHSEKMSSLGEMAGGLAHEINNPLAIISGYSQTIKRMLSSHDFDKERAQEIVERITITSHRISDIISGLMSFSKYNTNDPFQSAKIEQIVNQVSMISEQLFSRKGIEILLPYGSILHEEFECQPTAIVQALINLIANGVDAARTMDEKWVRLEVIDFGKTLEFSVIDSGRGIPKEIQDKMFEPFYTSKQIGKGTGLGLATTLGIAQSHEGKLFYELNSINTKFTMVVPKQNSKTRREQQAG